MQIRPSSEVFIHTKTKYAGSEKGFTLSSRDEGSIANIIRNMEDRESQMYSQYFDGCSSFGDFLNRIKQCLLPEDLGGFKSFSNEKIKTILQQSLREATVAYDVYLKVDDSNLNSINIMDELKKYLSANNVQVTTSGELRFRATLKDISQLKSIVNSVLKTRYKTASKSVDSLKNRLKTEFENASFINITNSDNVVQEAFFPFSDIGANEISLLSIEEQNVLKNRIRTFYELQSGYSTRSNTFQKAFNETFDALPLEFFVKKSNLNYEIGAAGEFQIALLQNYLTLQGDKVKMTAWFKAKISDTLKSRQSKVDVTLLNEWGIQSKNINEFYPESSNIKQLHTTIFPIELGNYPNFPNSDGFCHWIANYYFNTTFQNEESGNMGEVKEALKSYFIELAHLDFGQRMKDTVNLYWISGRYLVPASQIARQYVSALSGTVSITSSWDGMSNEEFHYKNGEDSPQFTKYFLGNRYSGWEATPQNASTYESLVSNRIQIRTNFKFGEVLKTGYALW